MTSHLDEEVVCLRSQIVKGLFTRQKLSCPEFLPASIMPLCIIAEWTKNDLSDLFFLPRSIAETDESYKHIITYTIINCNGFIFNYRRGPSGGEERLHGQRSIGVGGHVSRSDIEDNRISIWSGNDQSARKPTIEELIILAAHREVREEMNISNFQERSFASLENIDLSYVGALSDDSNPVGRVHLGLIFELRTNKQLMPREHCLADPKYESQFVLSQYHPGIYEGWSHILNTRIMKEPRQTCFA